MQIKTTMMYKLLFTENLLMEYYTQTVESEEEHINYLNDIRVIY